MSLFVGLCLVLYLILARQIGWDSVNDVNAILTTWMCAVIAPLYCWSCIRLISTKAHANADRLEKIERSSYCIWALFGFATLFFGWQDVVDQSWGLANFVLVDEILLLLPMVLSLLVLIYVFESTRRLAFPVEDGLTFKLGTWVRLEIIGVMAPAMTLFGIKDLIEQASITYWLSGILLGVAFIAIVQFYPILLSVVWELSPLEKNSRSQWLRNICRESGASSLGIWQWNTNQSTANAMVLGVMPWGRKLIITDQLLNEVDDLQLAAIVRHEIGHVRFRHLLWRLVIIISPVILCSCLLLFGLFSESSVNFGFLLASLYLAYVFLFLGWQTRLMEHQADLFAANLVPASQSSEIDRDPTNAGAMVDSLRMFAGQNPEMFNAGGWLHPSLIDRITLIERAANKPSLAVGVNRKLFWSQFALVALNVVCFVALLSKILIA